MFNSNPQNAAIAEAIKEALLELPIGATISYAALSEKSGADVLSTRHVLNRARQEAEEQSGGLFETIRGYGLRRMSSERIPSVGLASIQSVRRAAQRGVKRLSSVRANDMSDTDRQRLLAHKSQLGAIALVADGRKTVAVAAKQTNGELPPKDVILALMKGDKG